MTIIHPEDQYIAGNIPREEAFNRLLDKGFSPKRTIELAKKSLPGRGE